MSELDELAGALVDIVERAGRAHQLVERAQREVAAVRRDQALGTVPAFGALPGFDAAVAELERALLVEANRRAYGNRSEAARLLGITRSRFHDRWRVVVDGRPARSKPADSERD